MTSSPTIQFKNAINEGPIRATSGSHVMVCVWIGDLACFAAASFSKRICKNQGTLEFLVLIFFFFCQIVKSFEHSKCKLQETTKIARLRKLLGNLLCDMVLGSGIPICKQVNCNLEGKLYVPMDSIKRIREDSNLKLRIRVRSGSRIRANSGQIRIPANSCEFHTASLVVPGGSLWRQSWAACAAVFCVCGPGH